MNEDSERRKARAAMMRGEKLKQILPETITVKVSVPDLYQKSWVEIKKKSQELEKP